MVWHSLVKLNSYHLFIMGRLAQIWPFSRIESVLSYSVLGVFLLTCLLHGTILFKESIEEENATINLLFNNYIQPNTSTGHFLHFLHLSSLFTIEKIIFAFFLTTRFFLKEFSYICSV